MTENCKKCTSQFPRAQGQQSKTQRYFIFYHTSLKKSANPHNSEAEIRACLSVLVKLNYQNNFRFIFFELYKTLKSSESSHWRDCKYKSKYYVVLDKLLMTND